MIEQVIMIAMAAMKTECKTLSLLEQEGISQLLIYGRFLYEFSYCFSAIINMMS